jgi:acyl CoA:acetate/3-ketoacid CoA transferase beta subunit
MEITPDEFMAVCIARQIVDGEVVAQGLATPLVAAGYLLARLTHAPHLYFVSAIGQSMCRTPAPLSVSRIESLWLDQGLSNVGFVSAACDILPSLHPKEFFRPAQVDSFGNTNNIAFGRNYLCSEGAHSRLRLPGTGGIPDVTSYSSQIFLYVPRHSRLTFVSKLDVRSGLGYSESRLRGYGPRYLVSDMGQFDFAHGRMRLITYHPHCSIAEIQARTSFELEIAPDVCATPEPGADMLRLLREEIDPLGIRRLELLSGSDRRQLLAEIMEQENL